MVGAIAALLEAGRVKLYCVDSHDIASWSNRSMPLEDRARRHGHYERWILDQVVPWIHARQRRDAGDRAHRRQPRRLPRRELRAQARRPVPARDLHVGQLRPVALARAGASAARRPTSTTRWTTSATCTATTWTGCARGCQRRCWSCGQGAVGGHDGRAGEPRALRRAARGEGDPHELDVWGHDVPHDWPSWQRTDRPPSATVLLMAATTDAPDRPAARHRGGLAARVRDARSRARPDRRRRHHHRLNDRADHDRAVRPARQAPLRPRHRPARLLVLPPARVAEEGRADGRRLPAQQPVHVPVDGEARGLLRDAAARPEGAARRCWSRTRTRPTTRASSTRRRSTTSRSTSARSREQVGYPLFMKPFDGGQWVGVSRIRDSAELHRAYDESGERLMHLQASVEGFDVFARSLSIGAETMVMKFRPDAAHARPLRGRARLPHARGSAGRSRRSAG